MPSIDDLIKKFPPDTQEILRVVWNSLSPNERSSFQTLLNLLPVNSNLWRMLIRLSTVQFKMAFGKKHRVAIVGPANVGKSTLYNQLVSSKLDRAEVGPLPGTTRANQQADAGLFTIVDTPGADAVGEVGEREREQALDAAAEAEFLVIMFDAIQGVKQTELELYNRLIVLKKPHIVVLNKIDLVKWHKKEVLAQAAANLKLEPTQVIPLVARDAQNLDQVLLAIAVAEPEIVAALGRALPQYRWQLAWRSIVGSATASAVIALTPLPIIDFVPLVAVQSIMVLSIARIYNYEITPSRARELIATFGLGFLGRTLFAEMSKLGGIPGWMLGIAIASSITVAMGYAAVIWFDKGEKVSGEKLTLIIRSTTSYLLDSLKSLGKRRPSIESLKERISQSLETAKNDEIDLSHNPPSGNHTAPNSESQP